MNLDQTILIHEALAQGDWPAAASLALRANEVDLIVTEQKEAELTIRTLLQNLLDSDQYLLAAGLLWSRSQFNPLPSVTQDIFKAIHENNRLLIMAGSSLSKTYSAGVFLMLDFMRDPLYTNIKIVSANEDNLRKNLHSHITGLHKTMAIPMLQELVIRDSDLTIGIKGWIAEMGISGIAIKQGTISSGGLRGHKGKPIRKIPHPRFGMSSRVRILVDEAQDCPSAAFGDLQTSEASMDGLDLIKIIACFNPVDMSRRVVEMAEPLVGWNPDQIETLHYYQAKSGYQVLRLDAARFENVTQRKTVYPNFLTYQAYLGFLRGGDNSAAYYVARGFPPMRDSANTVIPPEWLQTQRGEAMYVGRVRNLASSDLAFQGRDKATLVIARWGLAAGWRKENGEFIFFENRLNPGERKPRHVLTIDQLFILPKSDDTVTMSQELMGRCKQLMIEPENVVLDKTGNALGVWSHLTTYWGNVLGVNWGEGPTEFKVLSDDLGTAEDNYDNVPSEMWGTFKRWLDPRVCGILINPIIPTSPLYRQLSSRRYSTVKEKMRVESKETYKARNAGVSPDESDCFTGETLVTTPTGNVRIDSINVGDEIVTPFGITTVGTVRISEVDTLTKAYFSNGSQLEGKGKHEIFTWNRGWIRLDSIVMTDEIETDQNLPKWNILNSLFTRDTSTSFKQLVRIIKTEARMSRSDFYTELSGLSTMGKFLTICASIIKTVTGPIIESITWSSFLILSTRAFTWLKGCKTQSSLGKLESVSKRPALQQLSGMAQKKDSLGISKTESMLQQNGHTRTSCVTYVESSLNPEGQEDLSIVPERVPSKAIKKQWRIKNVLSAIRSFLPLFARSAYVAPTHVLVRELPGFVKVYNLTLWDHNVYYANGVLVTNCFIQLPQLIRLRLDFIPGIMEADPKKRKDDSENEGRRVSHENVDKNEYLETSDRHAQDTLEALE